MLWIRVSNSFSQHHLVRLAIVVTIPSVVSAVVMFVNQPHPLNDVGIISRHDFIL